MKQRKPSTVHVHRPTRAETGEFFLLGIMIIGISSRLLWPVILLSGAASVFGLFSAVPCMRSSLSQGQLGRGPQLHHSMEWCPPIFVSSFVVGKVSLMPRMRKAWSLSLLDRAQLLHSCYFEVYIHRGENVSTGGLLSPVSVLLVQVLISFDSFYSR